MRRKHKIRNFFFLSIVVTTLVSAAFFIMNKQVQHEATEYDLAHPLHLTEVQAGNVTVLTEGKEVYQSIIDDVNTAKKSVYFQFFIIRYDEQTKHLLEALRAAARRGVEVKLSGDLIGSREMSLAPLAQLKKDGVVFSWSRPLHTSSLFHSIQHRNHRRIGTIDETISYIGGFNVGNEYVGKNKKLGDWTDVHIRLLGDNTEMVEQFRMDWEEDHGLADWATRQVRQTQSNPLHTTNYRFLFSTGVELEQEMLGWIRNANEEILIQTPYFIPSTALAQALVKAAKRGVNIKIMIPKVSDAWFTQPPAYEKMRQMIHPNITWLHFTKGFLHSKVLIIDDHFVDVGTANWDPRSFYLNDESNCLLYGQEINQRFRDVFSNDEQFATRITEQELATQPWWKKVFGKTPKDIEYYF